MGKKGVMEKIKYLGILLHMYQPPWQSEYWVRRIADECYIWLTDWLASQDDLKVTVNINFSLVEKFQEYGLDGIIENLVKGVERGSIELTGSAVYHALLPLIPSELAEEQIDLNEAANKGVFGDLWKPRGFFPPEAAISPGLVKIIKDRGYGWTLTDSSVYDLVNRGEVSIPSEDVATISGLPVFFRSNEWSNKFAQDYPNTGRTDAREFVSDMREGVDTWFDSKGFVVLAFDMETIGHQQSYNRDTMEAFTPSLRENGIYSVHINDLLGWFPKREELGVENDFDYCGSWSTLEVDFREGIPYALWRHPKNPVHKALWDFVDYGIELYLRDGCSGKMGFHRILNICPFCSSPYKKLEEGGVGNLMRSLSMMMPVVRGLTESPEELERVDLLYDGIGKVLAPYRH